uniref:Uncharacterized protein n=1 Tax=Rhizophora mucronata TaxID=61149 RepID=A0A2P2QJE9_RHIMU
MPWWHLKIFHCELLLAPVVLPPCICSFTFMQ